MFHAKPYKNAVSGGEKNTSHFVKNTSHFVKNTSHFVKNIRHLF